MQSDTVMVCSWLMEPTATWLVGMTSSSRLLLGVVSPLLEELRRLAQSCLGPALENIRVSNSMQVGSR